MGWFASFWNEVQMTTSLACPVLDPPFNVDFRNYWSMDFKSAHELFWDFNQDGSGLHSLDFLGWSGYASRPSTKSLVYLIIELFMCNGWFLWQLSICSWAVLLVVSPTRGVIILVIKYIVRIDLPVCSTMTNMCQTFFMCTLGRTSILDFSSYLHSNPKEESLQLLQWRHIAFYKPKGHSISVQPFGRATRHSPHYIKWCS